MSNFMYQDFKVSGSVKMPIKSVPKEIFDRLISSGFAGTPVIMIQIDRVFIHDGATLESSSDHEATLEFSFVSTAIKVGEAT